MKSLAKFKNYDEHFLVLLFGIFLILILLFTISSANAQMDMPNPPANIESISAGAFVVPMDTINQAIVTPGNAPFNLKAYGLINKFLQNGIPVKWAIRAGKGKDAIDFSAASTRVFPSALPAATVDYVAGPFIVPDTVLPCGLTTSQIIQNFGNNVAVYQLQQNVNVDIRYTLNHRPKIAVFNNGGNQQIHIKILKAAAITDYVVISAAQISMLSDCFTFASEPHADTNDVSLAMVNGIRQFVLNGGNFLGQCFAVYSYENRGFFHTTAGIALANTQVTNLYSNNDMAAAQMHGALSPNRFGSCQNWALPAGTNWQTYQYPMVTDQSTDTLVFAAAHLIAPNALGGNVFFLGGHDYGSPFGPGGGGGGGGGQGNSPIDSTDLEGINGVRFYLNATLMPSASVNAAWANAGPDITVSCGDSTTLGCGNTGPVNSTLSWSPATGLSCTNCPHPIAKPAVTTTYIVTVTTSCDATDTVVVTVNSNANITVNSAAICPGTATTLTGNGGVSYTWSPSAGLSGTAGTSVTANPASTTTYTLTGINSNGCQGIAYATVSVNQPAVINVNSPTICQGDTATLTATGGVSYSWLPPAGLLNATGNNVFALPGTTSAFTVTATDANGCINTATATVTVNSVPSISSPAAAICAGDTVVLNASSSNSGTNFNWSTGVTSNSISVSPNTNTIYIVTGTDPGGCSATLTVPVTVNPLPVVVTSNAVICTGSSTTIQAQGAQNYLWQSSSGQTYTAASINVSPTSNTTYTVIGTDANGCINTATSNVTINPLPTVTATNDSICGGGTATVQATGGVSYIWMPGNLSSSSISVSPSSTTSYTVTATDANGCTNTATSTVIVGFAPALNAPAASLCAGDTVVLNVSSSDPGIFYNWSTGDTGTSVTVIPNGSTNYTVTGTSPNGCWSSLTVPVTVNPLPTILTNNAAICPGDTVTIQTQGAQNYSWQSSSGQTYSSASINVSPTSNTTYTVTGTDANGCINTATSNVTVNPLPTVTATNDSICGGGTATVQATGGVSYIWMPGNLSTSSISVSPSSTTSYTVTATDANGCTNTSTSTVNVNSNPMLTAQAVAICIGDTATLNVSSSTPGINFNWSTGGLGSNISVSPSITSTYTVTGTSPEGCMASIILPVTVNSLPIITSNDTSVCPGSPVIMYAHGAQNYVWQSQSGQSFTSSSINLNPVSNTTYTITGTDANGCKNNTTSNITILPLPVISATSDTICNGQTATIQASGGTTYNWMPGNLNSSAISVSPTVSTGYTVKATDGNGCSNTATSQIVVNPLPFVSATSAAICSGDSAGLIASGAASYIWMPTGVTGSVLQVSPATTTTYDVTGYSNAGCSNTVPAIVTINPKPIADFNVSGSGCAPVAANFQNLSSANSGSLVYHWDFGDGTTSDQFAPPAYIYNNSGIYTVKLIVSTGNCFATVIKPNVITIYPDPVAAFNINNGINDNMQQTVSLTNLSTEERINYWSFGDGAFDYTGNNNPQHTYSDTGSYTICLLITDSHGCVDSVCNDVTVNPIWSFYIPNAFTPNGDAINDGFIGQSINVIEHEMWIYDRWGLNIYHTGKTRNPETAKPWNGKPDGSDKPVQNDVYVWVVRIKDIDGKSHQLVGHVTVVK